MKLGEILDTVSPSQFLDFIKEHEDWELVPPKPKQPIAWAELRVDNGTLLQPVTGLGAPGMFEAAWPEIKRRVRELLREALEAQHRAHKCDMAHVIRNFSMKGVTE